MAINEVFQQDEEISRLAVQNRLLGTYEQPIYKKLLFGNHGLRVLDIGCNNGSKTVNRFVCESVAKVIGLEYHPDLAAAAQNIYGSEVFSFYQCDVECPDFTKRLSSLMEQNGVDAFDVIHASFVLTHLKNPCVLLTELRQFLAPSGRLFVIEADDSVSKISPDDDNLLDGFLNILELDPFSGNRRCGKKIADLLTECGYNQIAVECALICADETDAQMKRDIFTVFFSYLPEDVRLLRRLEPQNAQYAEWGEWVERHFDSLKNLILAENTKVSLGISVITCFGGLGELEG